MVKDVDYSFKIILVGPAAVGKTTLVKKFVERKFEADYLPTAGANVMATQTAVEVASEALQVNLAIWDIAAQDTFRTMRPQFYSGAKGAFLVGDLTRPNSFEDLAHWNSELKTHIPGIPIILLANKSDLHQAVDAIHLQDIGGKVGAAEVLKTSALTGQNVALAFQAIAKKILAQLLEKRELSREKKDARVISAAQYLYVISRAGIVLFEHNFGASSKEGMKDSTLIGGVLVAISDLLKEIAKKSAPLKVVRQEGFNILVEEGREIIVALAATGDNKAIRKRILNFIRDLERGLGIKLSRFIQKGQDIPARDVMGYLKDNFS